MNNKKFMKKLYLKKKNVEEEVADILGDIWEEEEEEARAGSSSETRKRSIAGQRLPKNIPSAPLDNIAFHTEDRVSCILIIFWEGS